MSVEIRSRCRWRWLFSPVFIALLLFVFAADLAAQENSDNHDFHLTILHTNDLHSHDESFPERGREIGGLPRIGHMIRYLKKHEPNAVVVDAGDIFEGTPLYTRYHGEVEVAMLNMIGYDIFTIGNHEFDDGPENLAKQLEKAKFKIINCNMDLSKEPELAKLVTPYVVKEIDGQKVAFIGVVTPELNSVALRTGNIKLKAYGADWTKPVFDEVSAVKAQGIDKIVLVSHSGLDNDKELARDPDVDVIIGGHSHTRLDQPVVVPHADGSSTTIVQTGCFSRALGKLELTFNDKGEVITPKTEYHLINMTEKIFQDADLKAYVDEKMKPLMVLRHTILAAAEGDLDNSFRTMPCDSAIGDLITDALVEDGKSYGVTIAFENRGGIRGRIDRGPISVEKVEEVWPFDNKVVYSTITGDLLHTALEHSLDGGLGGHFFEVHGLKLAYDPQSPKDHRIVFLLAQNASGNWQSVKPQDKFKVAMNDYSFDGGEGYDFKSATNVTRKSDKLMVAMENYLRKHPRVTPQVPNRIVAVSANLLTVESKNGEVSVQVRNAAPKARLLFVCGTKDGVTSIDDNIAVPLFDPRIVLKAQCDARGQFDWHGKATELAGKQKAALIAVVEFLSKTSTAKHIVSYPVPLNEIKSGSKN